MILGYNISHSNYANSSNKESVVAWKYKKHYMVGDILHLTAQEVDGSLNPTSITVNGKINVKRTDYKLDLLNQVKQKINDLKAKQATQPNVDSDITSSAVDTALGDL